MADQMKRNETTVPLGSYMFIQDGTNGKVKIHVGPTVVTLTGSDTPVVYNKRDRGAGHFIPCGTLDEAIRDCFVVPEGFYAVLMNPAKDTKNNEGHPPDGLSNITPELSVGHKVVIEGPKMFALWPGQYAKVVRGHSLKSNQYLLCRVYNEQEARSNWTKATIMTKSEMTKPDAPDSDLDGEPTAPLGLAMPESMTVGTHFIVRGTDISFYIPPTGVAVIPSGDGEYVRDAVSLEQLEYCILVDENGAKRIPRGPAVVFPKPTETFLKGKNGEIKARAIELNEIQGLHIKVTKAYKDELLNRDFKEGEEFFLTGKQCPIYFPREEHALMKYDGNTKHYGIAIPSGEARYVMNRNSGEIRTVHGPAMLLCNPINDVVVRRVLSPDECTRWYPGNTDALAYNQNLADLAKRAPTTRAGVVSEGEALRSASRGDATKKGIVSTNFLASSMYSAVGSDAANAMVGDEFSRSSTYTAPRTLTLNTKFEGVPRVNIWTGYAVMVVNSKGDRRVEQGPKSILLEYDETLETLYLSTGKPKNTDKLLETPYLRVLNNKVADLISVETSDHVTVDLKVSYHINFTGDATKWWDVQNYVKHACDHMRSALKAAARNLAIEQFYGGALEVLRKVVLGEDEKGTLFEQNGMKVVDVELLSLTLADASVKEMLISTQREAVKRSIALNDLQARFAVTTQQEDIKRREKELQTETEISKMEQDRIRLGAALKLALASLENDMEIAISKLATNEKQRLVDDLAHEAELTRERVSADQDIAILSERQKVALESLVAETEAHVKRFQVLAPGLSEALLTLSSNETMAKIAKATSVQRLVGGSNVVQVLGEMFKGMGLDQLFQAHMTRTPAKLEAGQKE